MATAPPPPDDALPSYEEAVSSGTAFNTVNTRSYDSLPRSLPRSRADTGEFVGPYQTYAGHQDEEDVETALLKAELQRLKQENLEAKKKLLRQEIENERLKAGASSSVSNLNNYPISPVVPYSSSQPVVPYSSSQPVSPPQPQPSSSTSPASNETASEEEDCKIPQRICCTFIGLLFAFIVLMIILA